MGREENERVHKVVLVFIVLLAIGEAVTIFTDSNITITLNRLLTYGILFIGLRNTIELFALRYYDQRY